MVEHPFVGRRAHRHSADRGEEARECGVAFRPLDFEEPVERVVLVGDVAVESRGRVVLGLRHARHSARRHDMARISYDQQTAAAYKAVREVSRDGLSEWREAIRRHLRPSPGMTLVDIGAGTGQFAAAFSDWFDLDVLAVEPSAAMREQIPGAPSIHALDGHAADLPLP